MLSVYHVLCPAASYDFYTVHFSESRLITAWAKYPIWALFRLVDESVHTGLSAKDDKLTSEAMPHRFQCIKNRLYGDLQTACFDGVTTAGTTSKTKEI